MKKILAICMSIILTVSSATFSVSAASASNISANNKISLLSQLNIMSGDPNGNLRLNDKVSRAECAKIAVAASSYRNAVSTSLKLSPFRDVPYTHWGAGYIKVAATNSICRGYTDATFRPNSQVTYAEAVTMMLKVLGYTNDDFGDAYPNGQLSMAKSIGLTDDMNYAAAHPLTRSDMVTLAYNALNTKTKGTANKLLTDFDVQVIEDVTIIASSNENASMASDKISTTSGNYYITTSFDKTNVGKKGDLYIKNSDHVLAFVPTSGNSIQKYVIYSLLSDGVIAYSSGSMKQIKLTSGTTAYDADNMKSTYGSIKIEMSMGDVINVAYSASGAIDYITYEKGNLVGPVTLSATNWLASLSGINADATIVRNGTKTDSSSIASNDIAYYSKELQTVFVYNNRVTGVYESASPNKDTPNSVVVSGKTYEIEGVNAFSKLASSGSISLGDTVTLLLGKDGKIADVLSGAYSSNSSTNASSDGAIYGFVYDTGIKQYTTDNKTYTAQYVALITTDGEKQELRTSADYSGLKNTVVKATITNGVASLTSSTQKVYGKFNWSEKTLGTAQIDSSVSIIDVCYGISNNDCNYIKVFGQRLNGITLTSSNVLFAQTNSQGKVTALILKDVTGDCYKYGIVTKAESTTGASVTGSYTYDIGGSLQTVNTVGTSYSRISSGDPAQFLVGSNGSVEGIYRLTVISTAVTAVTDTTITAGNQTYTLADKVMVYYRDYDYNYTVMPLSELSSKLNSYSVQDRKSVV